jgi:hypothetical protein
MEIMLNEITPKFQEHSWRFTKTQTHNYRFSKNTKEFHISLLENAIEVLVPLKDSVSLYKTNFDSYFSATEYVMDHLNYQENI